MIDFLIRAWFEKREKQTKKAFSKLKEKQFCERVHDIRAFCSKCWESESWKVLKDHYRYYFKDYSSDHSHWAYKYLKDCYEAFVKECNASMDILISIYNDFYDDIWKNTNLDVSQINIYGHKDDDKISYEIYTGYNNQRKPSFDHYAKGWTEEWHEAYCTLANLMLLIYKCCDVIDAIQKEYKDSYPRRYSSFYSIKRDDKPATDKSDEIYEQAKRDIEASIDIEVKVKMKT